MTLSRRRAILSAAALPLAARAAAGPGRLVVPLVAAPSGVLPGPGAGFATRLVGSKLFEGLSRNGGPGLARFVEVTEDERRFTFRLREGVSFHDGTPLTAAAVLNCVPAALAAGEAFDPLTPSFRLAEPDTGFLERVGRLPIAAPASTPDHPVGTGPFRWVDTLRLDRFDRFAGPPVRLDGVEFPVLPDPAARLALLRSVEGVLLAGPALDWAAVPALRADAAVSVTGEAQAAAAILALNTDVAPLDQPAVRQVLAAAIDRAALLREAWAGLGRIPAGPRPDLRAAAGALNEAGLRPDDGGVRARFPLLHPSTAPWPRAATLLANTLRQIGIVLVPQAASAADIALRRDNADFVLALAEEPAAAEDDPARIVLVRPDIPLAADRRLLLPGGLFASWADAALS